MTTTNTNRTITLVDENLGRDVEYIFDQFDLSQTTEERYDEEHALQKAMYQKGWSTASRVQDKLDKLEADSKRNRATIDNRSYYHKMASEAILHMEFLQDQYDLGLLEKEDVRKQLSQMYKACQQRLKAVRWVRRTGGGVNGYIRGCGYTPTALKAMANTALSILEEMGYRIPDQWWMRNSQGVTVIHEFTENKARQERSGLDWTQEIEALFYELD